MILLPFVSFLSAFSSPSNMRRPAFIPLPLAACVVAVMALAVCAQAEEAGISAAEKIVNEDPFCAAVEGVNQFTDVSSQEEMVKGYAEQGNTVKFMQDYRGDNGKGAADLGRALKFASQTSLAKYSQGLIAYAAPGIAFGVIMTFWWIIFSSCRMCGRCCKPEKAQGEYNKKEKLVPVFMYLLVGVLGTACSIVGMVYLMEVMNTVTGTVCDMDIMRIEAGTFFDEMVKPLENTDALFATASTNVRNTMAGSGSIDKGLTNLTGSLTQFGKKVNETSIPGAPCLFCRAMATSSAKASGEMDSKAGPAVTDLVDLGRGVQTKVVAGKNSTTQIVKNAKEINGLVKTFMDSNVKTMSENLKGGITPIKGNFSVAGMAFFSITLLAIVLTLIGLFFLNCGKYTNCTGVKWIDDLDDWLGAWLIFLGWWLTAMAVIAMFFIGGFLLPFSVATSDTCVVIDDFKVNMNTYLKRMVPGEEAVDPSKKPKEGLSFVSALQGCYNNESLLDVLNLTSALDFSSLNYSQASYNEQTAFDFAELAELRTSVHALTPKNFSFDESAIAGETNATKKQQLKETNETIYQTIGTMKSDIDKVETDKTSLKGTVKTYSDNLKSTETELDPVNAEMATLKKKSYCGFVATHIDKISARLCAQALSSMLNVALACLLNALFGVFMIWNGLLVNKRFGGHGLHQDDVEKDSKSGYSDDFNDFDKITTPREGEEGDIELGDAPPPPPDEEEGEAKEAEEEKTDDVATEEYVSIGSPGADRGWNEEEYVVYDDEEDELHYMEEADHEAETGLI